MRSYSSVYKLKRPVGFRIFYVIHNYMKENFLQWLECMVICIEARYMSSCYRGILDLISRKYLGVVLKHSMIYRQDLSPKNLNPALDKFLQAKLSAVHLASFADLQVQSCLQGLVKRCVLTTLLHCFT